MPDLKPIFIPQITDENSQWEKDFAKAFQSLSDDLKGVFSTMGYYVDRGDPSAYDFTVTSLTMNNNWQNLDLSSIVPIGAKTVCLMVSMIDERGDSYVIFRKKGNVNIINYSMIVTQVAEITVAQDMIVPCDIDRFIEYFGNAGIDHVYITVKGWWI